ncbi:substrate-binding domain-containing protein [Desulfolutivibrio sulfoxidireducens]|uniref:substrate-binding domain-containing protein n=1 Tax=Desulfolutivibrio sulfoxidireducens TaxID=2773299 RepID=UPI00159D36EA|nr:substrate-binding domain-containing protein [Desulfolutivibrio sulfoxidireducens]
MQQAACAEEIQIGGTGSGVALLQRIAPYFVEEHPQARIDFVTPALGSSGGMRALKSNVIDLVIMGRELKDTERSETFRTVLWGRTPMVFATSDGQLGQGLGVFTLIEIFGGKRRTWDNGSRIRFVLRDPQDADTLALAALSPDMKKVLDDCLANPSAVIAENDLAAVDMLEKTPGSLGTTTLSLLRTQESALRTLTFEGVSPSVENLSAGRYPLSKKMYLVYREKPSPLLEAFLSWLQSPKVAEKLQQFGTQALFQ